ncbi:MAG: hypothetical protein L0H70_06980 [Xanthomonadales bacterium]|nr:hypothetical protein [Xanthomonadales bacterium]
MPHPLNRPLLGFAGRLRFPQLFALTAGLLVLDFIVPDPIPFLDEIVLGLATLLLGSWRKRPRNPSAENTKQKT